MDWWGVVGIIVWGACIIMALMSIDDNIERIADALERMAGREE